MSSSCGDSEVSAPVSKGNMNMTAVLQATYKRNLNLIVTACQGNVELQTIVMNTIAQYQETRKKFGAASLADIKPLTKEKPRAGGDDDLDLDPTITYHRNMTQYRKWALKHLQDLLYYCDPQHMNRIWLNQFKDKDRLYELLEFAFDLKILVDRPDRAPTLNKLQLFQSFKSCYIKLGKRVAAIADQVEGGHIDWKKLGHYSITYCPPSACNKDGILTVESKTLGESVVVGADVHAGDTGLAAAVLKRNCSQTEAFIMTKSDTYLIQNFFPKLSRTLRRRKTAEDRIASEISGGHAEPSEQQPPKRQKSSAIVETTPGTQAQDLDADEEAPRSLCGVNVVALNENNLQLLEDQGQIPSPN
jgi:formylmethanofuran dehydrogenase subunit E